MLAFRGHRRDSAQLPAQYRSLQDYLALDSTATARRARLRFRGVSHSDIAIDLVDSLRQCEAILECPVFSVPDLMIETGLKRSATWHEGKSIRRSRL